MITRNKVEIFVKRSTHIFSPAAVLPSAIAKGESIEANFSELIAERRNTI